jgi:hypothetical protein
MNRRLASLRKKRANNETSDIEEETSDDSAEYRRPGASGGNPRAQILRKFGVPPKIRSFLFVRRAAAGVELFVTSLI